MHVMKKQILEAIFGKRLKSAYVKNVLDEASLPPFSLHSQILFVAGDFVSYKRKYSKHRGGKLRRVFDSADKGTVMLNSSKLISFLLIIFPFQSFHL